MKPRPHRLALAAAAALVWTLPAFSPGVALAQDEPCAEEPRLRVTLRGSPIEEEEEEETWLDGTVGFLMPGLVHVPVDGADDPGYQWGLGVGHLIHPFGDLPVVVGGVFEHSLGNPPDFSGVEVTSHQLRIQAFARPGLLLMEEKLFAYGNLALGYVAWPVTTTSSGDSFSDTANGVAWTLGGGAMYSLSDPIAVGAELGFDLQWFFQSGGVDGAHNFDASAMAAYFF